MTTPPSSAQPPKTIQYPKVTVMDVIREFYRVAKLHWFGFVLCALGTITATVASGIFAPIFYKRLLDMLTSSSPSAVIVPALIKIIALIFILNFVSWIGSRTYQFMAAKVQADTMRRLRQGAYEYIIGHSYTFFTNTFSGSLVQRINRFMRAFERVTDRIFYEIIPLIVRVTGVCIVVWSIQPMLTVALVVWMVLFFLVSFFFSRWKIPYDIKAAAVESRASGVLSDSLSNHTTIQLFNRHTFESMLFGLVNREHRDAMYAKWTVMNVIDAVQALINITLEFLIFYFAIKFWSVGALSIGTFFLIQMYVIGLMSNFWAWGRILRDLYESFADAKELVEMTKLAHSIQDAPNAPALTVAHGAIDITDLSFGFNADRTVLNRINLKIKAGERVALIGPSGAGKSTLVRLILRLYDIERGSIVVDGQNIRSVTQGSLREAISFVPQDPILFHRSLMDNIRYGRPDATNEEVIQAAKLAHCHEFISSFPQGYETYVGERGVKLSGGERQRVAIARAILKNAPILILDEATSSLDSHSEMLIQDALNTLMKGKTVVVIAHRLSTIRSMHRIVVLEKGRIVEEGSHEALLAKPAGLYAKLWSLQSDGFIKADDE
ncbi:MAG TPA: ABC transporter ATP-binding protein [Candidatus Paceibacterota bacterium]